MASTSLLLALVVLAANALAAPENNTTQEVINVSVYFESYCPDSVRFLTKQLFPIYMTPLKDYMNVTLVPYGKSQTMEPTPGDYNFTCHHGEKECKGNKVIACVLKDKSVPLSDHFKFINCTSVTIAANTKLEEYPVKECATKDLVTDVILSCAQSSEGSKYLAEYGKMTMELSPALSSVPTIVFNDKFMESENKMAVSDFRKALCSKITGTKPAECSKNSAASLQYALFTIVAALLVVSRIY